ncbi:protein CSN12 [Carpediemonas membranifera]|uniref:Protein CSN12 n=1 Tax=Carpediemonas membranifera TaxID=201153 RepID=A0A8J6ASY0_9EUKA|nr:protein CSN12 [Carpediemonas membranifera]|eukprot:KAG9393706.1 protein CSN12 [Carpediemonas membranifera]
MHAHLVAVGVLAHPVMQQIPRCRLHPKLDGLRIHVGHVASQCAMDDEDADTKTYFEELMVTFLNYLLSEGRETRPDPSTPSDAAIIALEALVTVADKHFDTDQTDCNWWRTPIDALLRFLREKAPTDGKLNSAIKSLSQSVLPKLYNKCPHAPIDKSRLQCRPVLLSHTIALSFQERAFSMAHATVTRLETEDQQKKELGQTCQADVDAALLRRGAVSDVIDFHYQCGRVHAMDHTVAYGPARRHMAVALTVAQEAKAGQEVVGLIASYMVPLMLADMRMPRYDLVQAVPRSLLYIDLVGAVSDGNLGKFCVAIERTRDQLAARGLLLIWEEIRQICTVQLLRTLLELNRESISDEKYRYQMSLSFIEQGFDQAMAVFEDYLRTLPVSDAALLRDINQWDATTVVCQIASLIQTGRVRGYIAFKVKKMAFSKKEPFPGFDA